jgi:hypothetical protein
MPKRVLAMAAFLCVTTCARPSNAQSSLINHARISVNFGAQPSSSTFNATTNNPVGEQTATLTSSYSVPSGQFVDAGVTLNVTGGFGIGIGVSRFNKSQTASISGSIPHPLVLNRSRPISGTSPPLERDEIAGYIDAAYVFSANRVDLAVSGGPAFFTVSQDLVANVTYTEAPPFDSVAFTGAVVTKAMATNLGFNAGVDIGVKLSKNFGVGAIVRYSRASVTFPLANTPSGVRADVGGTQAGGGVRVYF